MISRWITFLLIGLASFYSYADLISEDGIPDKATAEALSKHLEGKVIFGNDFVVYRVLTVKVIAASQAKETEYAPELGYIFSANGEPLMFLKPDGTYTNFSLSACGEPIVIPDAKIVIPGYMSVLTNDAFVPLGSILPSNLPQLQDRKTRWSRGKLIKISSEIQANINNCIDQMDKKAANFPLRSFDIVADNGKKISMERNAHYSLSIGPAEWESSWHVSRFVVYPKTNDPGDFQMNVSFDGGNTWSSLTREGDSFIVHKRPTSGYTKGDCPNERYRIQYRSSPIKEIVYGPLCD